MAQIANSSSIYGASGSGIGGLKEDFQTLVAEDSRKAPLFDMIKEGPVALQNMVEIDQENLAAPSSLKVATGADFVFGVQNETSSIYNYVQESQRTWELGAKAANSVYVGRVSEKARRMSVALQELKRGIEYDILNSAARAAGDNTVPTPAAAGGLPYWITTNTAEGSVITQDMIVDLMGQMADYTGNNARTLYLVGDSSVVSSLSKMALFGDSNVRVQKNGQSLDVAVKSLNTDFGSVVPMLVGTGTPGTAYLLDMNSLEIRFKPQEAEKKARGVVHIWNSHPAMTAATNAYRGVFSSFWTLIVRDEKLNAKIVLS